MNNDLAGDTRVWLMATVGRGMAIFAQVLYHEESIPVLTRLSKRYETSSPLM